MLEKIRKKKVLVIGLARSGIAAAKLLHRLGAAEIILNDKRTEAELKDVLMELKGISVAKIILGGHPLELISEDISLLVKSPGIKPDLEIFKKALNLQIPIISEVELAYHFIKVPIVGITGTNGKTTTTSLISEMLCAAGIGKVITAGNIGNPLSDVEDAGPGSVVVAELSSFQLDDTVNFRPHISVVLNITEDHLDYHGDIKTYIAAKQKILLRQNRSDFAVINHDDLVARSIAEKTEATVIMFSSSSTIEGFGVKDGLLMLNWEGISEGICLVQELSLPGKHNLENSLAAAAAAWAAGASIEAVSRVLKTFKGVEHRLELVKEVNGVMYVNDSKATNPEACFRALSSFSSPKILIAGGLDKGADFAEFANRVGKENVRLVILIGETAPIIKNVLVKNEYTSLVEAPSLLEAVHTAHAQAVPGDVVLLSPACASWDMFCNFEERGRLFKELVATL